MQENIKSLAVELGIEKSQQIRANEKKYKMPQAELELRQKVEIHEIRERKNQHINELMQNHEYSFREMKEYFNEKARENLELIKTFREKW